MFSQEARPAMDKARIAAAIAARGEQIKTSSAEYLWICRGNGGSASR
jgi:hypothetical protein